MKIVPAHRIDPATLAEKHANSRSYLVEMFPRMHDRPDLLDRCAIYAVALAAGCAVMGDAAEAPKHIRNAARLLALQFAHAAAGETSSTTIELDGAMLTVQGETDDSSINVQGWLNAMWCALACGDVVAMHWLAAVDFSRLSPASVRFNAYLLSFAASLRALVTGEGDRAELLEETIARCEPSSPELEFTQERIDRLDYPVIRALFLLLANEQEEFVEALVGVLQGHGVFWQSSENALAEEGLICLPALALRRMAAQRGQDAAVQSPYLPPTVWQATTPAVLWLCPYCISPKSPHASHCGVCQRDGRSEAPLELATALFTQAPRRPCRQCAMPVHGLAVTCPRCRRRP